MEKKKILVIDDESSFSGMMALRLEASGYEVKSLSSAKEVLSQVHSFRPDLILLDLLMPSMGGIEIAEMLDKDALGMNIPIIVVSALTKDSDKNQAYLEGVVDYIEKPVDDKDLLMRIERALHAKEG